MEKSKKNAKDDHTDTLHHLLQTKDTINSILLEETKRNSDLACQISTAETQLRELTENALRNLRSAFEKKRKESFPIIKRLEDTLKELKKSERALSQKASSKNNKHSELKRANRRIKDAGKMLKDLPNKDEKEAIFETVVEQITNLCQRLMQIPMTLSFHGNSSQMKLDSKSPTYFNESENTDSDASEKETNISKYEERPRANSDSKTDGYYKTSDFLTSKRTQTDTTHKFFPGTDNDFDRYKLYMDRFEAIGFIPNDSESSDGSLRQDSPGPLRGYPWSVQRRPSSAGRAERHIRSRDRSSSLPLLNGRRCHTPTFTSNRTLFSPNDLQIHSHTKSLNGFANDSTNTDSFGRKYNILRISPLGRKSPLKDRQFARKSSPLSPNRKDEILLSYERNAENLVRRQIKPCSPTDIQEKHSSDEVSDMSKTQQSHHVNGSFQNADEEFPKMLHESFHINHRRKENKPYTLLKGFESIEREKEEKSTNYTHQRLTPKRLLPKVPSSSMKDQAENKEPPKDPKSTSQTQVKDFAKQKGADDPISDCESFKPNHIVADCLTKNKNASSETNQVYSHHFDLGNKHTTDRCKLKLEKGTSNLFTSKEEQTSKHIGDSEKLVDGLSIMNEKKNFKVPEDNQNNVKKSCDTDLDVEEIKFKENVRTARRDIIDKLRSKYALPRQDHDSRKNETSSEPDIKSASFKTDDGFVNKSKLDKNTGKINIDTPESRNKECESPKPILKREHMSSNISNNVVERHSPVMSIAGLKRYKSTTNLSKLESFDNATSKFDENVDKLSKRYDENVQNINNDKSKVSRKEEVTKNKGSSEFLQSMDDYSGDSNSSDETKLVFDILSKSLPFERKSPALIKPVLDRQGLMRSVSVENIESYQLIDTLSSSASAETVSNKLKESGISTMSFSDLRLSNTQGLSMAEANGTFDRAEYLKNAKLTISSSDNGFESSEGVGNSEDSLDDLNNDSSDKNMSEKSSNKSPEVYPAKLIVIKSRNNDSSKKEGKGTIELESKIVREVKDKTEIKTGSREKRSRHFDPLQQSTVKSAVEKFENTIFSRSRPEKRTLKQFKENTLERRVYLRSRSASATRNPASITDSSLPPAPRALYPRGRFGSASETLETKPPLSSIFSSVKKSRSIEADLNKICQEETPESIRREWIHRRSTSATRASAPTSKLPSSEAKKSIFEFENTCILSSQYLRSRLSGIVSMQNGRLVLLDELQMCLYLLSPDFRIVYDSLLEYFPCGICITGSNSFAIAFPYKSLIRVFYIVKDKVTHTRDIKIACKEWINDINHSKGKIHVLCKAGHIHVLGITGREEGSIDTGMTGKLQVNESGSRFYIHGERKITRFNEKGEIIWTKSEINANYMFLYGDKVYVADNEKKKIRTLSEIGDTRDLLSGDIGPVSAAGFSYSVDKLYICQYSDEMDDESTRIIKVYRKCTT